MAMMDAVPNHEDFQLNKQSEQDKTLLVKFFTRARPDHDATTREGRPMFRDVEHIDIKIPGQRGAGACRPATERDKQRFPEHYAAFKQRVAAPVEGTPLTQWPPIPRAMCEELEFLNIKTVEQLAGMADANLGSTMGLMRFKQLAQSFLEAAKVDAPLSQMRAELEARDNKISAQEQTIADLAARIDAMEKSQRPEAYQDTQSISEVQVAPVTDEALPEYRTALDDVAPESAPDVGAPPDEPEVVRPSRRKRGRPKQS